jgi:hypothetical protein
MADVRSVAQGVAMGAKVKGFMVYTDVTTNGLAELAPYATPESVIGKKIAASQTDSVRVILPVIFDARKLDPSSINWLAADPSVYFSLALSGQVDLFTASSDGDMPTLIKVASAQGKTVYLSTATENGAIIMPPVPAFYHKPKSIDDIVNQTVGRCLDLFDIDVGLVKRWRSDPTPE